MPPAKKNAKTKPRKNVRRASSTSFELDHIEICGAEEHNLKSVDVHIPKKKLVVMTGVSGSGKSSLAFDTLYAEGQRRYVESLSAYARQFLGQMEKPRYDTIRGLSPTISIEQKTTGNNPRSTVGTITEISDYLRVLWARTGPALSHLRRSRREPDRRTNREDARTTRQRHKTHPALASARESQGRTPRTSGGGATRGLDAAARRW
jgi:excinuclease UvrABC ATPase subunit